jgi:predicted RNA-binding Zn-ribbon protein involved in translation (DUF1610 family)
MTQEEITREEYYNKHWACPKCGNTVILSTLMGYIFTGENFKDRNSVICSCGFKGIYHDLIEERKILDNIIL